MGIDGGGQQLYIGDDKLEKGEEELGAADKDPGTGGVQPEGIRYIIKGGSAGGVAFWVRDVVHDPLYVTGPGQFST